MIYLFTFKWIDDSHYNEGYNELKGEFLGTEQDFKEYCKAEEDGQGFGCWDVEKRPATEEEIEEYNYIYSW